MTVFVHSNVIICFKCLFVHRLGPTSTLSQVSIKPGFHLQQTPPPRCKKQSDYVVEQSSFPLIALFWLKIGRCRGRNWLNGNQALSQLLPRQRLISSQTKTISVNDDCSTLKPLCFCAVVVAFAA